ncbi:hypothetical protein D9M68_122900 [compost metagenome]
MENNKLVAEITDLKERIDVLHGSLIGTQAMLTSLVLTHPQPKKLKPIIRQSMEHARVHFLNESYGDEVRRTLDDYEQLMLQLVSAAQQ